jgi:hypothetical protein
VVGPQTRTCEPQLHCDTTASVLAAIEAAWAEHHGASGGIVLSVYAHLAQVLGEEGFIVDTVDGLEILEHCRRRNLPIVDILYALEERVRAAGYRGERLGLADFKSGEQMVYVFYDASRFKTFEELKLKVGVRVAAAPPAPSQPGA